jgi:pyridoxamine 5'-phosphate oxidase
VALDGSPRVRTLVFRGWSAPAQLDLLTDGRSAKAVELAREPRLELCWLLPRARCQFRLRGERLALTAVQQQSAETRHWQQLQPGARALWGWPPPGAPLEASAPFPGELDDTVPVPESFELLRIELQQVELLELSGAPHRRRRWRVDQHWREENLNP